MTARFAALLGVLLVVAGCAVSGWAAPQAFIEGSTLHTMNVDGFGTGQQAERAYGWDELADTAKFVVAYPNGVGRAGTRSGATSTDAH